MSGAHPEENNKPEVFELLLAKDLTIIRANGEKVERQGSLEAVPDNARRGRGVTQPNVQLLGECDIYTCIVTTTHPKPGFFWNTRLVVREDGEWRCLSWQVTKIPTPQAVS